MKKSIVFASLSILILVFQNCGKIKSSYTDEENTERSELEWNVEITKSPEIENKPLESVLEDIKIDLADYMISSNIYEGTSNLVYNRLENQDGERLIFSVTKFNDSRNVEVLQADSNFIYIRYESSPESYGGLKNVVRRFSSVSPDRPSVAMESPVGNSGLGMIWSKRYLSKEDLNVPMVTAHSIDAFNFASGENTAPQLVDQATTSKNQMYIWHSFADVSSEVPFVSPENQPDHKLIVSQQWSSCNVEQYEYAIGIGYVGWRSLVSTHPSCSQLIRGDSTSTAVFKNYYRNGQEETYKVVQGMDVGAPIDISSFTSVAAPSFFVSGLFLDDYPYVHSQPNDHLDALRSRGIRLGDLNEEDIRRAQFTADVINLYRDILQRSADEGGLNHYVNLMMNGMSLEAVENDLLNSEEYRNLQKTTEQGSNLEIVTNLYRNILKREPDEGGLNYYVNLLDNNRATEEQIIDAFFRSDEYKVRQLYVKYLRREADPEGLTFYLTLLNEKKITLDGVEADIIKNSGS